MIEYRTSNPSQIIDKTIAGLNSGYENQNNFVPTNFIKNLAMTLKHRLYITNQTPMSQTFRDTQFNATSFSLIEFISYGTLGFNISILKGVYNIFYSELNTYKSSF